jgi:hypothetical protein
MPAWRPLAFTVEAMVGINSLHVPTAKRPCLRHRIPKMIRSGQEREQRTLPVFLPVSSLLFAFAEIS